MRARIGHTGELLRAAARCGRALLGSPRLLGVLTFAALALGGVLRLNRYFDNRSLFQGEAYIASSVIFRNFVALADPLDYYQIAPVGWISAVKLATEVLGISEPVMRLVPLLAGLGSLPLFYLLTKQLLSPGGALIGCLLFAVADPAIHWSVSLKPYSTDLLFATAMLLLATRVSWRDLRPTQTAVLAGLGALGLWISLPAGFVLAAVGVYGALASGFPRVRGRLIPLAVIAVAWFLSFGALYSVAMRDALANEFQRDAWGSHFVDLPGVNAQEIAAQLDLIFHLFTDPVGTPPEAGAPVFLLLGLGACLAARPLKGMLLLAPIIIAYFVSSAGIYPFWERLMLFCVPSFHILIALGVEQVTARARGLGWLPVAAMLFLLAFTPLRSGISRGLRPRPLEEMRPVAAHVLSEYRAGDAIYVYYAAEPAWKYYLQLFGASATQYEVGSTEREEPKKYVEEILRYAGQRRLWLIFSHVFRGGEGSEESLILEGAQCVGTELEMNRQPGASAYLYDMTRPSQDCQGT